MAVSLNGSSDYVAVTISNLWNLIQFPSWTSAFWFNAAALPSAGNYFGLLWPSAALISAVYLRDSGQLAVYGFPGGWAADPITGFTASTNTWYHVCMTSTNGGTAYLYINGAVLKSGASAANVGAFGSTAIFYFGQDAGSPPRFLNGRMAEIAFWREQLSATEVLSLAMGARAQLIRPKTSLGNWALDAYGGGLAFDRSVYVQNGVINGAKLAPGPPFISTAPVLSPMPSPSNVMPAAFFTMVPPVFTLMPQIVT
jgi:hypothetical protein